MEIELLLTLFGVSGLTLLVFIGYVIYDLNMLWRINKECQQRVGECVAELERLVEEDRKQKKILEHELQQTEREATKWFMSLPKH